MDNDRQQQIEQVRMLPDQLEALVKDLTPEQLTMIYIPGEWSVAQNVHHLADAHMNLFVRFKNMVLDDRPTFMPFDVDAWAESDDATNPDIVDSLAIIRGLQRRWARFAASMTDEQWKSTGQHPLSGEVNAVDSFAFIARHGQEHLDQITKTLAAGRE